MALKKFLVTLFTADNNYELMMAQGRVAVVPLSLLLQRGPVHF